MAVWLQSDASWHANVGTRRHAFSTIMTPTLFRTLVRVEREIHACCCVPLLINLTQRFAFCQKG
jgi:hypothetical protein